MLFEPLQNALLGHAVFRFVTFPVLTMQLSQVYCVRCRTGAEPLSYAAFLDRLDRIHNTQARIDSMCDSNVAPRTSSEAMTPFINALEDAAAESGTVCFHGMHELHTSTGNIVWLLGETEDAVHARYALAMPPWRLGSELPPVTEPIAALNSVFGAPHSTPDCPT